ncbi:response regulator [Pseudoalteromonas phenolica]|uniref:Response regulator receiver protein n=1 Tax=Pseudoalteromonas phenolica TaxID=161398 RepID=A0A0S2JXX1_9GAMM|nr:response regulator [Pseudoalteromonas phenolica]ALO40999.1 Response regulator receiver protein [Pseudoalteromonas phenolica]MBE0354479.1 two-component system, unclassified family, response regulator [Pseudoalteromonas phenolica O-BC30]TMO55164.1 response regulator [Pseudoalteromonas phenolica]|tara:strand:- start:96 stop:509 length:414 start_codon:yes stop_codon:yes gene_type:complete
MNEIVLVEDDPDDIYLFRQACARSPNAPNVKVLQSAKELIVEAKISVNPNRIYLLDLNMPEMSGLEALDHLQKNAQLNNMIVVCYSTSDSPSDIRQAYELGAKSFLRKPSSISELTEMINTITHYWFKYNKIGSVEV